MRWNFLCGPHRRASGLFRPEPFFLQIAFSYLSFSVFSSLSPHSETYRVPCLPTVSTYLPTYLPTHLRSLSITCTEYTTPISLSLVPRVFSKRFCNQCLERIGYARGMRARRVKPIILNRRAKIVGQTCRHSFFPTGNT